MNPPENPNDPPGSHDPQVKNHWASVAFTFVFSYFYCQAADTPCLHVLTNPHEHLHQRQHPPPPQFPPASPYFIMPVFPALITAAPLNSLTLSPPPSSAPRVLQGDASQAILMRGTLSQCGKAASLFKAKED